LYLLLSINVYRALSTSLFSLIIVLSDENKEKKKIVKVKNAPSLIS